MLFLHAVALALLLLLDAVELKTRNRIFLSQLQHLFSLSLSSPCSHDFKYISLLWIVVALVTDRRLLVLLASTSQWNENKSYFIFIFLPLHFVSPVSDSLHFFLLSSPLQHSCSVYQSLELYLKKLHGSSNIIWSLKRCFEVGVVGTRRKVTKAQSYASCRKEVNIGSSNGCGSECKK